MPLLGSIIHDAPSFEELEKAISNAGRQSGPSINIADFDDLPDQIKQELDTCIDSIIVSGEFYDGGIENNAENHE